MIVENGQMVPAFGQITGDFDFWPLILEKAWSKLFGSYNKTHFGSGSEVIKALTQAPVVTVNHNEDPDIIWNKLVDGVKNKYIMVCATSGDPNPVNLVTSHL